MTVVIHLYREPECETLCWMFIGFPEWRLENGSNAWFLDGASINVDEIPDLVSSMIILRSMGGIVNDVLEKITKKDVEN